MKLGFCDRCGTQLSPARNWFGRLWYFSWNNSYDRKSKTYELCEDCHKLIMNHLEPIYDPQTQQLGKPF